MIKICYNSRLYNITWLYFYSNQPVLTITATCYLSAEFTDYLIWMEYIVIIAGIQIIMMNLSVQPYVSRIHTIKIFVFDFSGNAAKWRLIPVSYLYDQMQTSFTQLLSS